MTEHTPLPWEMRPDYQFPCIWIESDGISLFAVDLEEDDPEGDKEGHANAELVIRACNSHYDLLAACEALEGVVRRTTQLFHPQYLLHTTELLSMAQKAIAKARGEQP